MTVTTIVRAAIVAVVVASAAVVHADRPPLEGAEMAAAAWLEASHEPMDAQKLLDAVAMTELPFTWSGASVCAKKAGTAVDGAGVKDVLGCLGKDAASYLADDVSWAAADPAKLPKPLAAQKKALAALAKTHTLVLAHAKNGKRDAWAVLAVSYDPSAKSSAIATFVQAR